MPEPESDKEKGDEEHECPCEICASALELLRLMPAAIVRTTPGKDTDDWRRWFAARTVLMVRVGFVPLPFKTTLIAGE